MFGKKSHASATELVMRPEDEHDKLDTICQIEAALADIQANAQSQSEAHRTIKLPVDWSDSERIELAVLQLSDDMYTDGLHVYHQRGLVHKRLVLVNLYVLDDEMLASYYDMLVVNRFAHSA